MTMQQYTSTLVHSNMSAPRFDMNEEEDTAYIDGHRVPINKIGELSERILSRIKLLIEEMAEGAKIAYPYHPNDIVDSATESKPGYSFMSSQNSQMEEAGVRVLTRLLSQPGWRIRGPEGTMVWNRTKMLAFMAKGRELNQLIMLAMHLGGGQPSRGTELVQALLCNGQNTRRSLYVSAGSVMWILWYHKVKMKHLLHNQF